jgi:hypothetical protein
MKKPQHQSLGLVDRNFVLRDLNRLGRDLLSPTVLLATNELPEHRRVFILLGRKTCSLGRMKRPTQHNRRESRCGALQSRGSDCEPAALCRSLSRVVGAAAIADATTS